MMSPSSTPDQGVPDSAAHPFRVARFTNQTGGLLERGPLAFFGEGGFLGQGVIDGLPAGAGATVPFALEQSLAVERNTEYIQEGSTLYQVPDEPAHGQATGRSAPERQAAVEEGSMKGGRGKSNGRWIDVSMPVRTGMVIYPSDSPVTVERTSDVAKRGDRVTLSRVSMGVHAGTHVDAPLHFLQDGRVHRPRSPGAARRDGKGRPRA